MQLTFQYNGIAYTCDTSRSKSLAITLDFSGEQANFFQAEKATSKPFKVGDFVADTRVGGDCNVDCLTLTPHCNGTHTETVGHIVNQQVWIADAVTQPLLVASLVSVGATTVDVSNTPDSYLPKFGEADQIISLASIQAALKSADVQRIKPQALIVRTLPNSTQKKTAKYESKAAPAFFSIEAMQAIIDTGIEHLLVDLPSVDRMQDDGLLTNHHAFWNVPSGTHELTDDVAVEKTITEMIFVEDSIQDGTYLLNLQVPSLATDAAPSRPVIFEVT